MEKPFILIKFGHVNILTDERMLAGIFSAKKDKSFLLPFSVNIINFLCCREQKTDKIISAHGFRGYS